MKNSLRTHGTAGTDRLDEEKQRDRKLALSAALSPRRGRIIAHLFANRSQWYSAGSGGLSLIIAAAVFLSGCSTTSVQTQTKAGADFSHYHTFALMPLPASGPAGDPGLMLRVGEPARQAVIEALTAKGLTQADRGQADIAVNLKGSSLPKTEVTQWGYSPTPISGGANPNYWSPGGSMPTVYHFDERTLTIEIYDNHEKGVVWVGWGKWDSTGEVKVDKLQEAIRKILTKFPAGATGLK